MEKRPPRYVVIAYDEDEQELKVCTLPRDSLAGQMNAALVVPWRLEDVDFKLDDESARTIGGVVFGLLAVHQPALKQYISVTPHPDAIGRPAPSAE
ncbi:hypothetical protein [Paraburkholderia antibiotica]|uniref:Uncharacterized protein n=1 Tax=Paraburkholderia antibiotica TaxID=2728839 RepID=A0A7X9X5W9_9BURK|nr:hypothetical protein [Paraburkholderia antibiotica]NML32056.1 hypothetical protein [Paraburkholderia antibiotica]